MLTEEEKLKILYEEQFRHKIKYRNEERVQNSKLIQFFNTNFGLFILSTILIGGITFIYGEYSDRQYELKEKKRLENELIHRFQTLQTLKDTLYWYQTVDIFLAFNGNVSSGDLKPKYFNFKPVYQEYANWSVIRLAESVLEIQENDQLNSIVKLINKNQERINHLRENWFLRLSSGQYLPKNVDVKTKTKILNNIKVQYNYYSINGKEVVVKEGRNQITKLAKIETNLELDSLINLITKFKN